MSIDTKIATLKSIASLDAELLSLKTELEKEQTARQEKADKRVELAQRTAFLQESIEEMERTRASLMAELRQMTTLVDKSREKLARCRNEREANAVQRELEELRRIQRERENEIQKLADLVTAARTDLDQVNSAQEESPTEQVAGAETSSLPLDELEALVQQKQTERDELATRFGDKLTLRRYDAVRARRGSGIAAARKGTCTACHIALPPMLNQQMLHQQELHTCPSCHRILYLDPGSVEEIAEG